VAAIVTAMTRRATPAERTCWLFLLPVVAKSDPCQKPRNCWITRCGSVLSMVHATAQPRAVACNGYLTWMRLPQGTAARPSSGVGRSSGQSRA